MTWGQGRFGKHRLRRSAFVCSGQLASPVAGKAAWLCLWVFAIIKAMAFGYQAFWKAERRFFVAGARTALGAKIFTIVGCQACISVPSAATTPSAVNTSSLKIPRFLCCCWDVGVFGQALVTLARPGTAGGWRRTGVPTSRACVCWPWWVSLACLAVALAGYGYSLRIPAAAAVAPAIWVAF